MQPHCAPPQQGLEGSHAVPERASTFPRLAVPRAESENDRMLQSRLHAMQSVDRECLRARTPPLRSVLASIQALARVAGLRLCRRPPMQHPQALQRESPRRDTAQAASPRSPVAARDALLIGAAGRVAAHRERCALCRQALAHRSLPASLCHDDESGRWQAECRSRWRDQTSRHSCVDRLALD